MAWYSLGTRQVGESHENHATLDKLCASPDVVTTAVRIIAQIHSGKKLGDILVFMPGEQDIIRTCGMLAAEVPSMETLPLYGSLPKQLQDRIYHKSSNGKCIVSTNIAETSLTIPNLVFVIDSGLAKEMLWNPRVRMNQLLRVPISRFSADQRKGRAGRISDGVCIRLYTQSAFQTEFRQSTMPAIRSSRMESEVLALLCAGHRNLLGLDFLDSPDPENIASAIRELLDL